MIKEALEWLQANLRPTDSLEIGGKDFIRTGAFTTIVPRQAVDRAYLDCEGRPLSFGTIESIIAFIRRRDEPCRVVVGSRRLKAYFDLSGLGWAEERYREYVYLTFNYPAPLIAFSFSKFRQFLDNYGSKIQNLAVLEAACRHILVSDSGSLKFAETGAVITMSAGASKGVEGSSTQIPKEVTVLMQTGTHEYEIPTEYLLQIEAPPTGAPTFTLTRREPYLGRQEMIRRVLADLRAAFPTEIKSDVEIYEGE
jgi:hypothetical protein